MSSYRKRGQDGAALALLAIYNRHRTRGDTSIVWLGERRRVSSKGKDVCLL